MKIIIEESVLWQALEALIKVEDVEGWHYFDSELLSALRTAIDAAEKIEPVGWIDARGKIIKRSDESNAVTVTAPLTPLYTHPAPAVPEGWQLVPKEPTWEMVSEGIKWVTPEAVYEAMLSAAPTPPANTDAEETK